MRGHGTIDDREEICPFRDFLGFCPSMKHRLIQDGLIEFFILENMGVELVIDPAGGKGVAGGSKRSDAGREILHIRHHAPLGCGVFWKLCAR